MDVITVSVDKIKPYMKNAKKHPIEQVQHIVNSISEFGFRQPIVLDNKNVIVIGHGRFEAAKKLGMKEVPCVYADDLSDEQIKALRLADNKTNESEWDLDLLGEELDEILNLDMTDFGFDLDLDFESGLEKEVEEDEIPEEIETRCKLGDIWKLGNHRLICGDSTDANVIDRLMDGVKADCVFTVFDVFDGSGSALIACEQLSRKCYICEIEPKYCDVILQRWESFTGDKAELIKDK